MEINFDMLVEAYSRISKISFYQIFIIAVILDIFTGYIKAFVTGNTDSKIGAKGLLKHTSIVALIFVLCPYLWILGYGSFGKLLIGFFITNYVISILENFDEMGVKFPAFVKQFFVRMQESTDSLTLDDIENIEIKVNDKKIKKED